MSDEDESRLIAERALVAALAISIHREGAALVRWLRRRIWMLRGVVLLNVACAAWNATRLNGDLAWLAALGVVLNVLGAWKALQVEADFHGDIRAVHKRMRDLEQKMNSIER